MSCNCSESHGADHIMVVYVGSRLPVADNKVETIRNNTARRTYVVCLEIMTTPRVPTDPALLGGRICLIGHEYWAAGSRLLLSQLVHLQPNCQSLAVTHGNYSVASAIFPTSNRVLTMIVAVYRQLDMALTATDVICWQTNTGGLQVASK